MKIIAPSILSCNFLNLEKEISMLNESSCEWIHVDVMDGLFVPNISFGQPILKHIRKHTKKTLDVHLMIEQPERYVSEFIDLGADILTVHYEASTHLHRTLQNIRDNGAKAGVAINPSTNVAVLEDVINELDLVCIMGVNPGFGGQKFIEHTYKKLEKLKKIIMQQQSKALIEIDGGVTLENTSKLSQFGVDVFVAGSTVFGSTNPKRTIQQLKDSCK